MPAKNTESSPCGREASPSCPTSQSAAGLGSCPTTPARPPRSTTTTTSPSLAPGRSDPCGSAFGAGERGMARFLLDAEFAALMTDEQISEAPRYVDDTPVSAPLRPRVGPTCPVSESCQLIMRAT